VEAEPPVTARRLVIGESDVQASIRSRAAQVGQPASLEVASLLRLLAESSEVRHAVEVGSSGGVTGGWLMAGMGARGVLTSIESDSHQHTLASAAYADLGVGDRVRAILGDAATVLERLSDDQYDLVLLQGPEVGRHLEAAERLLRDGGLLVVRGVDTGDGVAVLDAISGQDKWMATVLPLDGGLLLARLRTSESAG
jgi:predicted O-methyltransferase YrrM